MATYAGRRLKDMAENTAGILGIELLAAAQGMDFRNPHKSTCNIEEAKQTLRDEVDFYDEDRYFTDDIEKAIMIVSSGVYNKYLDKNLIPSF
jgi:histidine ammonia-lyase